MCSCKLCKKFMNFMEVTRGYALLLTLASCAVIFSYAYYAENFSFLNFFFLVLALCCVHLGGNLYDDWADIKKQLKNGTKLEDIKFDGFTPKAKLILNGTYTIPQVRRAINIFFVIALSIGLCFVLSTGWVTLLFLLAGAILTLLYPYASKYSLSEVIIGLIWGPLMIMGGYYALTGAIEMRLFPLSFAVFFATLALLHISNIMDWEFDIKNNKRTLAILSGSKPDALKLLAAFVAIPYLIVTGGVLAGVYNPKMLYVFLTLPMAVKLLASMKDYIEVKDVAFKPRWYWGFFENWKAIQEEKIDFVMFRKYLARNFAFFFALIMAIGAMIG